MEVLNVVHPNINVLCLMMIHMIANSLNGDFDFQKITTLHVGEGGLEQRFGEDVGKLID